MEIKWVVLFCIALAIAGGISEVMKEYNTGQCRIAAIHAGMATDQIDKAYR